MNEIMTLAEMEQEDSEVFKNKEIKREMSDESCISLVDIFLEVETELLNGLLK